MNKRHANVEVDIASEKLGGNNSIQWSTLQKQLFSIEKEIVMVYSK